MKIIFALSTMLILGACAKDNKTLIETDKAETPLQVSQQQTASPPAPLSDLEDIRMIYFDFDKHNLRDDALDALRHNVTLLRRLLINERRIVIKGHCDERGTAAYNMGLGERRAKTVANYLRMHGLSAGYISCGEEEPVCEQKTEKCWQLNRRAVTIIYTRD